jgi:hypothetical protein
MAQDRKRKKLSADESLKRMQEFAERKEHFIAVIRHGAGKSGEEAWREEIVRRVAEIREGKAIGRPVEDLLAELRKHYP